MSDEKSIEQHGLVFEVRMSLAEAAVAYKLLSSLRDGIFQALHDLPGTTVEVTTVPATPTPEESDE